MSKIYMMIGLPASGKSTIAEALSEQKNAEIVSSDKIREEVLGNINDQSKNSEVFEIVNKRIVDLIINGQNAIFDATNINYKKRMNFIKEMKRECPEVKVSAVLVATPYEECLERNAKRDRKVPEDVIKRMYYSFYVPQYYEGFSEIGICYTNTKEFHIEETMKDLKKISQDNPNHSLSLGDHCEKATIYINEKYKERKDFSDKAVVSQAIGSVAAWLHDIGKVETKTFENRKGEPTEIAHYYDHEHVGSYKSLFYTKGMKIEIILKIASIIQWHMLLYQDLSDKTIDKYKNLLGEEMWAILQEVHEADVAAH